MLLHHYNNTSENVVRQLFFKIESRFKTSPDGKLVSDMLYKFLTIENQQDQKDL